MASQEQVQEEIERLNGLIVSGRYSEESIAWMRGHVNALNQFGKLGMSMPFRLPTIGVIANRDFAYEEMRDRELADKYGWDE